MPAVNSQRLQRERIQDRERWVEEFSELDKLEGNIVAMFACL